jgi:flagellin FlaB
MTQSKSDTRGFTGLEAAIVLIAFVVVAAVFTYVIFGVRGQDLNPPVKTVVEPAASPIQVIGNVYGYGTGTPGSMEINRIQLNVGLAPKASSLDLTKMVIVVSKPDVATITQLTYSRNLSTSAFTVEEAGTAKELTTLSGQTQGTVLIELPANLLANDTINIELRPAGSQTLSINRTTDATIYRSQILR